MSALSDRIAAEHRPLRDPVAPDRLLMCSCDDGSSRDLRAHTRHLIAVTERAVRDTIAQQLENLEHDRAMTIEAIYDGRTTQWVEGHDDAIRVAAALTREGTTP